MQYQNNNKCLQESDLTSDATKSQGAGARGLATFITSSLQVKGKPSDRVRMIVLDGVRVWWTWFYFLTLPIRRADWLAGNHRFLRNGRQNYHHERSLDAQTVLWLIAGANHAPGQSSLCT